MKKALPPFHRPEDEYKDVKPLMIPSPHTSYIVKHAALLDEVEFKAKQKDCMNLEEMLDNSINEYLNKIGFCNKKKRLEEKTKLDCMEAKNH